MVQWKVLFKTGCHTTVHWLEKDLLLFHHNSKAWGAALYWLTRRADMPKLTADWKQWQYSMDFSTTSTSLWCSWHFYYSWYLHVKIPSCSLNLLSILFVMLLYAAEFLKNIEEKGAPVQKSFWRGGKLWFPEFPLWLFINVLGFACCVGKLMTQKHIFRGICWMYGSWMHRPAPLGVSLCAASPEGVLLTQASLAERRGVSLAHPTA